MTEQDTIRAMSWDLPSGASPYAMDSEQERRKLAAEVDLCGEISAVVDDSDLDTETKIRCLRDVLAELGAK